MTEPNSPARQTPARPAPPDRPSMAPATGTRRLPVAEILGTEREATLIHNGEAYRLRITANNKLILTK